MKRARGIFGVLAIGAFVAAGGIRALADGAKEEPKDPGKALVTVQGVQAPRG